MKMETKFLRLRTEVELGSRFGDWSVCWLGGWQKHRLSYLVMLVKLEPQVPICQPAPAGTALPSPKDEAFASQRKTKKSRRP